MIITHYGKESFKVQLGDLVLAFNPISKKSKLKQTRFGADVVLVSLNHSDFNGVENVTHGDKKPFLVMGPGEYEVKGVFIKGFLVKTEYEGKEKINTIYYVALDGMHLCFLGAMSATSVGADAREAMSSVDVLFAPIAGGDVLDPASAHKLSRSFSPNIIIPMDYKDEKSAELTKFLKEAGAEAVKPVDKLTIKKKDVEGKEGEIVVLKSD